MKGNKILVALQDCKSMVICKIIDMKEFECIKRSMHCSWVINEIGIQKWGHEMNHSIYTIEMNYHNVRLSSIGIDIWLHLPEACILVSFQAHKWKPLHKSTWALVVLMPKGEEKKNVSYFKPMCSIDIWISVDKNTVIACRALPPWSGCSNVLATHASDPTDITRSTECCNSTYYSHCSPLRKAKPTWILHFAKAKMDSGRPTKNIPF